MPETIITTDRITTDPEGRQLLEYLNSNADSLHLQTAIFYYDFPTYSDYEAAIHRPDILILSREYGIVALRFAGSESLFRPGEFDVHDADESLNQFCSILLGRLLKSKSLRSGRGTLKFDVLPAILVDNEPVKTEFESEPVTSYEGFAKLLSEINKITLTQEEFAEARSVIEGAKAITRPQKRVVADPETQKFALALSKLENEISNFDQRQRQTALSLVQGPQRIRGLAGSGKTIILAMKAAHIHLTHPDSLVLVTFYTRSLRTLLRNLISRFYRHYKDEDPDWDKVHIRHGWGRANRLGVYTAACVNHGAVPINFGDARKKSSSPFDFVCRDLISKVKITQTYDYILVDEGQDFPGGFYELVFLLAKGERDRKNIVWAYDELQNILNVRIRTPNELFGLDEDGKPRVSLERAQANLPTGISNDIVLGKCYRNQREVLVVSHALGFGIYSNQIVQMLEDADHWRDVGYETDQDPLVVGEKVRITRPEENSPLSIDVGGADQIIDTFLADGLGEEVNWIASQVEMFLDGGLKPEDIVIIALDDRNARTYFKSISPKLAEMQIDTNNIIADPYTEPPFVIDGKVTLSTVYRAKGNEGAVVFACGIDAINPKTRSGRNKLFAAFTRSKAWLRVSGFRSRASIFETEIKTALKNFPCIEFTMPDPDEVETIQRDLSEKHRRAKKIREKYIRELKKEGFNEDEIAEILAAESDVG